MGFWDYKRGTLRDYDREPFPHSLLRDGPGNRVSPGVRFKGFRGLGFLGFLGFQGLGFKVF